MTNGTLMKIYKKSVLKNISLKLFIDNFLRKLQISITKRILSTSNFVENHKTLKNSDENFFFLRFFF